MEFVPHIGDCQPQNPHQSKTNFDKGSHCSVPPGIPLPLNAPGGVPRRKEHLTVRGTVHQT